MQYSETGDCAWHVLCSRLGHDPESTDGTAVTCSLDDAWKAMLAFASVQRSYQPLAALNALREHGKENV